MADFLLNLRRVYKEAVDCSEALPKDSNHAVPIFSSDKAPCKQSRASRRRQLMLLFLLLGHNSTATTRTRTRIRKIRKTRRRRMKTGTTGTTNNEKATSVAALVPSYTRGFQRASKFLRRQHSMFWYMLEVLLQFQFHSCIERMTNTW